ncbi:thialysine N-epsilon-acetyltransferase-like isoform X2 [Bufo bufo]|uniref:thialysine N-epsilon-acetyltransferase-like isoform X2 n=1 Tax=Bufo bufo TaxID=8384 RepID=UPI001ABE776C|nr:thialysine N-epsilon-acetyltransferase-like isoform X2 [Bufo bufo]
MDCIIRPAEPQDSPHIMRMIQELAEYEKITHFIRLTEEGGPFAGYALFANSYSSWTGRTLHLEDLYVTPKFRGRGLGRRLMKKVAQEGVRSGCSQIHLSVLKWNHPAISLYRSLGAENLTEEPGYQVMSFQEEALRNMAAEEPQ